MIQEEKQLLLMDLSARSPYKVKISVTEPERTEFTNQFSYENGRTLVGVLDAIYPDEERIIVDELDKPIAQYDVRCGGFNIEEYKIKPYLRPLSSMTEEEFELLKQYSGLEYDQLDLAEFPNNHKCLDFYLSEVPSDVVIRVFDWLNAHHFDYRGLILMGLALEAPKDMYKI